MWLKDVLLVVITGIVGLGGTVVGSWLSDRSAAKQQKTGDAKERRASDREAVVEVVDCGRMWSISFDSVALLMAAPLTVVDMTETDTFKRHEPLVEAYRRALTRAEVALNSDELVRLVRDLADHFDQQSTVTGPLAKATRGGTKAPYELVVTAGDYADQHRIRLAALLASCRTIQMSGGSDEAG